MRHTLSMRNAHVQHMYFLALAMATTARKAAAYQQLDGRLAITASLLVHII